ncbi:MAG: hypothetical protein K6G06_06070 [Butyrivibrio sp.]|nr:hypothetical protein [Butyrivibrio sp.]
MIPDSFNLTLPDNFINNLQNEINMAYGPDRGKQSGLVLIPAFLNDFSKVLDRSDAGKIISEEYMTEDKLLHLILTGKRCFNTKGVEKIVISYEVRN